MLTQLCLCTGYFLPTDKVGHWGVLNGKDAGKDLSKFDDVAPKLPKVGFVCQQGRVFS